MKYKAGDLFEQISPSNEIWRFRRYNYIADTDDEEADKQFFLDGLNRYQPSDQRYTELPKDFPRSTLNYTVFDLWQYTEDNRIDYAKERWGKKGEIILPATYYYEEEEFEELIDEFELKKVSPDDERNIHVGLIMAFLENLSDITKLHKVHSHSLDPE